ncbi:MAG: PAS domain S-box protein [Geobacteraceae bacterium]|nr:PAS domain S-box protein [Geobacteraceae bacterium]
MKKNNPTKNVDTDFADNETILFGNVHESLVKDSDIVSILSLAVEQSPISIVITDLAGTVQFVNPAFSQITGYTPEEALGSNPRIIKTELNPPELHKTLWETIIDGRIWEGEFINRKKNGAIFIEQAKITPIKNHEGKITHYIAFKEDITARKLVEQELHRLNQSLLGKIDEEARRRTEQERLLANQARLVAMGEMIGAIAHQWRQPLATLAMIVQRMHAVGSMKSISQEQLDEFKTNAMRQIKYMTDTIEEFRGYYNTDKITEEFSPYKCIADAIKLFEPQFTPTGIKVQIKTNDTVDQTTMGFPNEFKQVILNLLGNARDAILESRTSHGKPAVGRITVETSIKSGNMMIIDIGDNGCGIQENIASRIFDPYFTTKEKQMGTGIGLYMSRMIMQESLGGSLSLQKSRDGAVFRIKLPLRAMK